MEQEEELEEIKDAEDVRYYNPKHGGLKEMERRGQPSHDGHPTFEEESVEGTESMQPGEYRTQQYPKI